MADRIETELDVLRTRVDRLDERVRRLEGEVPAPVIQAGVDALEDGPVSLVPSFSSVLAATTLASFSLVGALVLRVAAQQGAIAPSLGTAMGLVYCAALLVGVPLVRRSVWLRDHGVVLQHAAILLVPLIILEMLHTYEALSVSTASFVLLAFGLGGSVLGLQPGRRPLVIVSLLVAFAGLVGLGVAQDGLTVRLLSTVLIAGAALAVAQVTSWPAVRPWVLVPVGSMLAFAVGATAFREAVPDSARTLLLLAAGSIWLLVLVNHLLSGRRVGPKETAWLPVASLWFVALLALGHRELALLAGGTAAALALVTALLVGDGARRNEAVGLAATGGLLAAATFPFTDATGLAIVAAGAGVWWLARRHDSVTLWVITGVDAVAAALAQLLPLLPRGAVAAPARLSLWVAVPGLALVGLWGLLNTSSREQDDDPARTWVATVTLGSGLVLVFSSLWWQLRLLTTTTEAHRLGTALLLALGSALLLAVGRQWRQPAWRAYGLATFGLLGLEVLLRTLPLGGPHAVVAVVLLGAASAVTSWGVRWPKAPEAPASPAPVTSNAPGGR